MNKHRVCTYGEARRIIEARQAFFISNCGCRERKGSCRRSRMDVCLTFGREIAVGGRVFRAFNTLGAMAEGPSHTSYGRWN